MIQGNGLPLEIPDLYVHTNGCGGTQPQGGLNSLSGAGKKSKKSKKGKKGKKGKKSRRKGSKKSRRRSKSRSKTLKRRRSRRTKSKTKSKKQKGGNMPFGSAYPSSLPTVDAVNPHPVSTIGDGAASGGTNYAVDLSSKGSALATPVSVKPIPRGGK